MSDVKFLFLIGVQYNVKFYGKTFNNNYTHKWNLSIAPLNNLVLDYVTFILHESFPNRERKFTRPPYTVKESGYGTFEMIIKINMFGKTHTELYDIVLFQDAPYKSLTSYFVLSRKFSLKNFQFALGNGGIPVPEDYLRDNKSMSDLKKQLNSKGQDILPQNLFLDLYKYVTTGISAVTKQLSEQPKETVTISKSKLNHAQNSDDQKYIKKSNSSSINKNKIHHGMSDVNSNSSSHKSLKKCQNSEIARRKIIKSYSNEESDEDNSVNSQQLEQIPLKNSNKYRKILVPKKNYRYDSDSSELDPGEILRTSSEKIDILVKKGFGDTDDDSDYARSDKDQSKKRILERNSDKKLNDEKRNRDIEKNRKSIENIRKECSNSNNSKERNKIKTVPLEKQNFQMDKRIAKKDQLVKDNNNSIDFKTDLKGNQKLLNFSKLNESALSQKKLSNTNEFVSIDDSNLKIKLHSLNKKAQKQNESQFVNPQTLRDSQQNLEDKFHTNMNRKERFNEALNMNDETIKSSQNSNDNLTKQTSDSSKLRASNQVNLNQEVSVDSSSLVESDFTKTSFNQLKIKKTSTLSNEGNCNFNNSLKRNKLNDKLTTQNSGENNIDVCKNESKSKIEKQKSSTVSLPEENLRNSIPNIKAKKVVNNLISNQSKLQDIPRSQSSINLLSNNSSETSITNKPIKMIIHRSNSVVNSNSLIDGNMFENNVETKKTENKIDLSNMKIPKKIPFDEAKIEKINSNRDSRKDDFQNSYSKLESSKNRNLTLNYNDKPLINKTNRDRGDSRNKEMSNSPRRRLHDKHSEKKQQRNSTEDVCNNIRNIDSYKNHNEIKKESHTVDIVKSDNLLSNHKNNSSGTSHQKGSNSFPIMHPTSGNVNKTDLSDKDINFPVNKKKISLQSYKNRTYANQNFNNKNDISCTSEEVVYHSNEFVNKPETVSDKADCMKPSDPYKNIDPELTEVENSINQKIIAKITDQCNNEKAYHKNDRDKTRVCSRSPSRNRRNERNYDFKENDKDFSKRTQHRNDSNDCDANADNLYTQFRELQCKNNVDNFEYRKDNLVNINITEAGEWTKNKITNSRNVNKEINYRSEEAMGNDRKYKDNVNDYSKPNSNLSQKNDFINKINPIITTKNTTDQIRLPEGNHKGLTGHEMEISNENVLLDSNTIARKVGGNKAEFNFELEEEDLNDKKRVIENQILSGEMNNSNIQNPLSEMGCFDTNNDGNNNENDCIRVNGDESEEIFDMNRRYELAVEIVKISDWTFYESFQSFLERCIAQGLEDVELVGNKCSFDMRTTSNRFCKEIQSRLNAYHGVQNNDGDDNNRNNLDENGVDGENQNDGINEDINEVFDSNGRLKFILRIVSVNFKSNYQSGGEQIFNKDQRIAIGERIKKTKCTAFINNLRDLLMQYYNGDDWHGLWYNYKRLQVLMTEISDNFVNDIQILLDKYQKHPDDDQIPELGADIKTTSNGNKNNGIETFDIDQRKIIHNEIKEINDDVFDQNLKRFVYEYNAKYESHGLWFGAMTMMCYMDIIDNRLCRGFRFLLDEYHRCQNHDEAVFNTERKFTLEVQEIPYSYHYEYLMVERYDVDRRRIMVKDMIEINDAIFQDGLQRLLIEFYCSNENNGLWFDGEIMKCELVLFCRSLLARIQALTNAYYTRIGHVIYFQD